MNKSGGGAGLIGELGGVGDLGIIGDDGVIIAAVKAEIDWADDWLKRLVNGVVGLPGVTRQTEPALYYSGSLKGKSRFDYVGGICPRKNELGGATGV